MKKYTAVVLFFSVSVFANLSEDIVCVGPDTVGEAASEAGNNPCNLRASVAERDVPVEQHIAALTADAADTSAKEKPGVDSDSSKSVQ